MRPTRRQEMGDSFGHASKPGAEIEPSHPFLAAKPPTTDPLTYLALLEYNLTEQNVTVLQHVLREDATAGGSLFADIGWDLISILLPLLAAESARECLVDIAQRGNPRECALKVEQGLRSIEWGDVEGESDDEEAVGKEDVHPALRQRKAGGRDTDQNSAAVGGNGMRQYLPIVQFKSLLNMLKILHSRIKTKQPSRFVATTLSAVLAAMAGASPQYHDVCVEEALALVESLKSSQRPTLPPRGVSGTESNTATRNENAADLEANAVVGVQEQLDSNIQRKLLQSFVTHMAELWMSSLDGSVTEETADIPALAWAARFQEQDQPQMQVPGRPTVTEQFKAMEVLKKRDGSCGRLAQLTQSLGLNAEELWTSARKIVNGSDAGEAQEPNEDDDDDDAPPEKPEDVPLSQVGCLLLSAVQQFASNITQGASQSSSRPTEPLSLQIFPDVAITLQKFVGAPEDIMASTAALPNALLDAILFLALEALSKNAVGDPAVAFPNDRDAFPRFLQLTSLLSANVPNSSIRYCAHVVTSTVLRSHPEPPVRLGFIRDTLENAPVDLLKAEAVGWLKGEIIEANIIPSAGDDSNEHSVFKTPMALHMVSMYLYPDLQTLVPTIVNSSSKEMTSATTQLFNEAVKPQLPFLLAVLNFNYLLLSMPLEARDRLDVLELHKEADVAAGFLTPLRDIARKTAESLNYANVKDTGGAAVDLRSDVMLLQQAIEHVERRLVAIAKEGT